MYKFILLSALVSGGCALDPDTSSIESQSTCEWDCEPPPPPPPPECPTCTIRGEEVDLDSQPENVDNNDRKVTFCHATGSSSNPYILITTDVNGCNGHADHLPGGNEDIFPTGGCAD